MAAWASRLRWAMTMIGDALEGVLRVARESRAPLVAAVWGLVAFVVAAILIRRRQDSFGWKLGASLLVFGSAAGALLYWSLQPERVGARYTGALPDTFRSGSEIVASGRLAADGNLDIEPDGIMARCPSQYAFDPDAPHDGRRCGQP